MSSVVILSPSRFSFYTICVTELLIRSNVNIKAIIVRRLFSPNRLRAELGQGHTRLVSKIWKKMIVRGRSSEDQDHETISALMQRHSIPFKKVDDFKHKYGIPVVYCYDLNDTLVVETLKSAKPDLVVFTGGGLIRKQVLANSGAGIVNCHMGVLPRYRGMDVALWPILEDQPKEVGVTVHFMDEGIDTGDILCVKKIGIEPGDDIKRLLDRFEPIMCQQIVETSLGYLEGRIERVPQKRSDGRQYFTMHRRLAEIAEARLRRRSHADKLWEK